MNTPELLPCPFCGRTDAGGASGIVSCYGCGARTEDYVETSTAIKAWNRRMHTTSHEVYAFELLRESLSWLTDPHTPYAWPRIQLATKIEALLDRVKNEQFNSKI